MKTKIISILWWSLTHPVALLTTLAKLSCSLAIIFAIVVSVCEIKIDFIEQGKKALISEIFNAGYSSNTSLTVASLRDFDVNDWEIDPEQEQQLAAATDMHHNFAYSQHIIAPLGSQDRFSLSDSTVFNLDKNINSGISYQNFNDKGFALIDSINEYTKAHPELQNDPHYQDLIKAQIAQIYFNSTLLPEHMSADIGLANTIAAITEKEAPTLEPAPAPAPASNSRANSNKVALPQEFAHNSQETISCSEPITKQITKIALATNDLASNHEAHSPYGYQDPAYSNDNPNGYQHNSYQNNNSLYSNLNSSNITSKSLNGSYNHGYVHGNSHSQGSNQHDSELKNTVRYQNHNLNRNLKNTRDDLYLAQEGKLHHQQSLASTNSSLKGQTYVYSHNHNLQPNQELKSLSPNSSSSSNYTLEPNANLAMSNTPNSDLTHHGLMSSDGILEEEEEELVLALPGSKSVTPSQAATITTSSANQHHMLSQDYSLSQGHGLSHGHDLSKSQNQGLSHSLRYNNSFEQEPILAPTQDAYYSQTNTNKIASGKAQLYLSASKSLGATISASKPTALTNSSVTSTAPNPLASLSSLASQASTNSSSYSGSTLSMDTIATPVSNSSYHHGSQSDSTTLSSSTSTSGTGTGYSTLSSSSSSSIHQKPNSKLNNTNSYYSNSNNSHSSTGLSSRQNDSSHYAIALAPTMTNNDMSTDHTISTAMVTALSTNTDPAVIHTRTNTATITANTDVSSTGTTATESATTNTVSSTDIAPATATATCTGTAITNTGTGTTANDSDGLATTNTINGIGTAITVTGTGSGSGSDITGTGTGTAMGTGTGAANSGDYDSEVAYLYRLDEELFDEEVERWDLEALEQLDLVIEDPEINLTAQDYQIIDEVMSTIDELRASGIAVDLDTVQMLCEHYMPQPYGTILLNNTKHEHLLSLLKSKQAKEQAKLAAVEQKESLVTELKDNSQPSKGQLDATLGAISNLATEQAHSLTNANAPTITNYPTKSDAQPSLGHSVFSVTNLVADDYIASMALETNTLYASLNTKMGANLGAPYSNALAYNYHDRLKSFNNSHSHSHSPDFNPNCAPAATAEIATAPAAIDTQATSSADTDTAATGISLSIDEACEERVGEEASLNFEALGIKEVAPATPLMTQMQEPNNFLLLQKPIVLSKEGIVGLFSYPKRPVITQDALVINMRTYEKTHGSDYKQCLQMLGHWPDIQSLLNNFEDNGEKGLTPATLGIIKINNMLNAHHYWSDPLNISTTFFSIYNYCKDLDSGLIAPIYHHGIDVLKQLYVLSINSPSTLWCSPEHMLTYKQVTKHPTNNSNNGQAIFAKSNLDPSHTQAASAPVPVNSTAETNFKAQSTSQTMAQLKAQAMSQTMAHAQAQAVAQAQSNIPNSSSDSIFYQGKGQELAPRYGKDLAPTVESELELGHGYGHSYGYDHSQVPSQGQAMREEPHYESLIDDTNSESNYYGMRVQQHPNTANHQGPNQGYNSRPSSSSKQGSSNLLGQEHYQEQGNWSANSHGYSHGQSQDFAKGHGQSQGQGLGWENSKEMERDKSLGMDYSQEYEGHSPEAMMGTILVEQSKQDNIELLGRTFNNSEDAKQALDQALGLSTAYDKHSYSINHSSYQTNALNGVKPFAKAAYTPTDLNEALDKQLIFNDLSYELMLPVYESLTDYQQAILDSCQPWLLNKKLLSYDKERAFASILQNLTKLIKLKVLSPKEAYALAHGQRPKLLKEQDIVAFAIIGQIVKQAHESHQGKFTKEQAHDLKLLKQALYYAKWPLLEQCIDPNFAYRYSKIRLKYGYQGQIINPLSFITDTLEPHLSHSPSSNTSTSTSTSHSTKHGYDHSHGYGLGGSNNIAQSTGLGLSTGTSTSHKLSSGHKLSTRAKSNLGSRGESEAMGNEYRQQHKQPEQQMQQYGNALAMSRNKLVNEYSCQEDNAKVINEVLNTAQNLRGVYQDLKTLEHGDILNSAQTIINAANRVGNNLPLNKSSPNAASPIPNQSSITDINQVFATGPGSGLATGSGSSTGSGLD